MRKRTVIYRGSLKSCNYSCSYCPFAKHRAMTAEMEKDQWNFARFCDSIERKAQALSIGAVFVTPYGEASIHRWYWEGLSRLAELSGIDRVGMQTNLSFSVEECLKIFDSFKGNDFSERGFSEKKRGKLCIWATFHPEMTTVDEFVAKCHRLIQNHVQVCAGAVGVPENIQLVRELREKLSPAVYLWINRMDGLKRNYEPDEIKAFVEIDPFFELELNYPEANPQMCADRCFVEADGKVRSCNISKTRSVNWYESSEEEIFTPACSRKRCTCYLSYGGRSDFALKSIFGEYSVYRITKKFRAIFFDLDGTLISVNRETDTVNSEQEIEDCEPDDTDEEKKVEDCESDDVRREWNVGNEIPNAVNEEPGARGREWSVACRESGIMDQDFNTVNGKPGILIRNRHERGLSDHVRRKLAALKEICPIFLATSMPETDVKRRLKEDMDLFQGCIFASGGYLCLKNETGIREKIYPIDISRLSGAMEYGKNANAQCTVSKKNGTVYKVTFIKRHHSHWTDEECDRMGELLKESGCRFFTEKHCLEIVSGNRDKGTGIEEICSWLGISTEDVLAVGNDKEDDAMERVCGGYMRTE